MENGLVPANQQEIMGVPAGSASRRRCEQQDCRYEATFLSMIYKQKIAVKTKPHITIANFLAKESMEETLIRWIHRICSQHKSFP